MRGDIAQTRHAIDHVSGQVEAIQIVEHGHVERRGRGALFFITANVKIFVIRAAIDEAVYQPRVAVKCEDDGPVAGENRIELAVVEAVRVLSLRLQRHQIYDIDEAHAEVR